MYSTTVENVQVMSLGSISVRVVNRTTLVMQTLCGFSISKAPQRMLETYKVPSRNTTESPIFFVLGVFRYQIKGIGIIKITTSIAKLSAAGAM